MFILVPPAHIDYTSTMLEPNEIHGLFEYLDGRLIWRNRPLEHFKNAHGCNIWNAKNAGKEAGCFAGHYRSVRINGVRYLTHRLVWAWHFCEWPSGEIDHINGDKLDNRIENLRSVTRQENARNLSVNNAKHGHPGVIAINGRWRASISVKDRTVYLGTYDDINEAIAARKRAEERYGFHSNHGRRSKAA